MALITCQPPVNRAEIQPVCVFTIHMRLFYSVQFGSGMAMDTLSWTAYAFSKNADNVVMYSYAFAKNDPRVVHFVDRIYQLESCQYGITAFLVLESISNAL